MKEYIEIKVKTLYGLSSAIAIGAFLLLVALIVKVQWLDRPVPIITDTKAENVLLANGKRVLAYRYIDRDSIFRGISIVSKPYSYLPRSLATSAALPAIVAKNKAHIESELKSLESQMGEMEYYRGSHNVQDEGFDMVVAHEQTITASIDSLKAVLSALDKIGSAKLTTAYRSTPMVLDSLPISNIILVKSSGGYWRKLVYFKVRAKGYGIGFDHSHRLVKGYWQGDSLAVGSRTDSLGTYRGAFDSMLVASGHGAMNYADSTYYEGNFERDQRSGFGFFISPTKLRAGEWQCDKFKGERMNYTSNRIYGIDISRYQHGKGRKYYPINWANLRIVSLGSISRKKVTGTINYPVSFCYIKSTEGCTVRNRYYARDARDARKYGVRCGAYHFFSTRTGGAAQARFFVRHSSFRAGDLAPVLDCEPTDAQIRKMGGIGDLFREIRAWMRVVEARTGRRPILYVNQRFVNKYLDSAPDVKRNYKVWIARYGDYKPDVKLVYWQLCPDGRVSGIHGPVDINVYNGYKEQFAKKD